VSKSKVSRRFATTLDVEPILRDSMLIRADKGFFAVVVATVVFTMHKSAIGIAVPLPAHAMSVEIPFEATAFPVESGTDCGFMVLDAGSEMTDFMCDDVWEVGDIARSR
jgi:hypothetical protein